MMVLNGGIHLFYDVIIAPLQQITPCWEHKESQEETAKKVGTSVRRFLWQ